MRERERERWGSKGGRVESGSNTKGEGGRARWNLKVSKPEEEQLQHHHGRHLLSQKGGRRESRWLAWRNSLFNVSCSPLRSLSCFQKRVHFSNWSWMFYVGLLSLHECKNEKKMCAFFLQSDLISCICSSFVLTCEAVALVISVGMFLNGTEPVCRSSSLSVRVQFLCLKLILLGAWCIRRLSGKNRTS